MSVTTSRCLAYNIQPQDFTDPLDMSTTERCPNSMASFSDKWCLVHYRECHRLYKLYKIAESSAQQCAQINVNNLTLFDLPHIPQIVSTYMNNKQNLFDLLRQRQFMSSRCFVDYLRQASERVVGGHEAHERMIEHWKTDCERFIIQLNQKLKELKQQSMAQLKLIEEQERITSSNLVGSVDLKADIQDVKTSHYVPIKKKRKKQVQKTQKLYDEIQLEFLRWTSTIFVMKQGKLLEEDDEIILLKRLVGHRIQLAARISKKDALGTIFQQLDIPEIRNVIVEFTQSSLSRLIDAGLFDVQEDKPTNKGMGLLINKLSFIIKILNIRSDISKILHSINNFIVPEFGYLGLLVITPSSITLNIAKIKGLDAAQFLDALRLIASMYDLF